MQLALWWALRRAVVYLKRASLSLERQAVAAETLARIEQDRWEREFAPRPKGKFLVGQLNIEEANKLYRETHHIEADTE